MKVRQNFTCRSLPWFGQSGCSLSSPAVPWLTQLSSVSPRPSSAWCPQPGWGAELPCSILPADGDWKLHFEGTDALSAAAYFHKAITLLLQAGLCLLLRPAFHGRGMQCLKSSSPSPRAAFSAPLLGNKRNPRTCDGYNLWVQTAARNGLKNVECI